MLPNGDMSSINEVGIKYYNDLIDALWEAGVEPIVTLYHWDMPLVGFLYTKKIHLKHNYTTEVVT